MSTNQEQEEQYIQIGGRNSKLAVVQSESVRALLESKFPYLTTSILSLSTLGDQNQSQPLYTFGGKSLWTKELEILLVDKVGEFPKLDLIVHSLKDIPTNLPDEFELGCITKREDPRDALVMKAGSKYKTLSDLPAGSIVGTSSIRRSSQMTRAYPHLKFESVRGNIQTRLGKLDKPENEYTCLILASAGLIRLGLGDRITSYLDEMYYAVGQGALGIEIRKGDSKIKKMLKAIADYETTICCLAERSLMRYLEGGCSVPLGVKSKYDQNTKELNLKAIIVSPDGTKAIEDEATKIITCMNDCETLGVELGDRLQKKGADEILQSIDLTRNINARPTEIENYNIQIGGRSSKLAVVQSESIRDLLKSKFPSITTSILSLSTLGDQIQTQPLYSFGGKALWTKELEILLVDKVAEFPKLDLIVHCLKDMPTNLPDEFELGCITKREDPRDALVMKAGSEYKALSDLPAGSIVGTSSIRRSSQMIRAYPHLKFESVRGNIQTRLGKLDKPENEYTCLILASAGLIRLGLGDRITSYLDEMYYAVGQGALGIEIRKGDNRVKKMLKAIDDHETTVCCLAERSLMRYLEGGCSVPLGVKSKYDEVTKELNLKAIIVSPDGTKAIEDEVTKTVACIDDCETVGVELGDKLKNKGAEEILRTMDLTRNINARPTEV
ncbi:HEM3 [[Candida] subhashii]|uniref:Porphobilinogen deaminase n=1 Tax=[Candida] subhashii TaxID=561895 RepID=A0A8J5UV09_9ASCO|nr:HEM3 [[Candida] subhashii]KAG7666242.1 HEM3 [[Candida] subhashii]